MKKSQFSEVKKRTSLPTRAEIRRIMKPYQKDRESALEFLKMIGVTVKKDGTITVKPIHV